MGYRERWRSEETAPALSRGKLFHEVLELHYRKLKEGLTPVGVAQEMQTSGLLFDAETGDSTEEQDLVAWIYEGYVEHYDGDSDWEILEVEMALEDWLPTETGTRSTFRMKGKVDLLIKDNSAGGGLWVVDHKTCKDMPKAKDVDFDDQTAVYTYLLRKRGYDIRGAIFNFCRTAKLKRAMEMKERFARPLTVRVPEELETMALEVLDTFRDAYKPRKRLPPRSPNTDTCNWRCPFKEPCLMARKGRDHKELLEDFGFVQDWTRH